MEYLIRFAQLHETFRLPELQSLASLVGTDLEIVHYDPCSPYCIVKLPNEDAARALITRSILGKEIFELWTQGSTYEELHANVRGRTQHRWAQFKHDAFRFTVDGYGGHRSLNEKREIIGTFNYMGFEGPIRMKNPDQDYWIMEQYTPDFSPDSLMSESKGEKRGDPKKIYFARWIANSSREATNQYDLKKRRYISTTSMDAELSLITANMAHAAPGKLFYDPFVGTGGFIVSAAHFGAVTLGSDIDGRSFRGKQKKGDPPGVLRNFQQYGTESKFGDVFTSDITNTPLREYQFLDGIVCDPPYGVREGLQVLGTRESRRGRNAAKEEIIIDGVPAHYRPDYIAPKRPYGFEALQNDILNFASRTLVTNGRLCMWMPTASDEDGELATPMHPNLKVISVSVQEFNLWSRRLITYQRLPEGEVSDVSSSRQQKDGDKGHTANELNAFRKKYFEKKKENKTGSEKGSPASR